MSTQINNGKLHVCNKAIYKGAPNQKKRIRNKNIENKNIEAKMTIKYNLCALFTALLINSQLEGPDSIKLLIMILSLIGGFQIFKEGE